jgi:transcription antitermination protein NusB
MPPAERPPAAGSSARSRNPRRRAREIAVQGLYQWLLAGMAPVEVLRNLRELDDYGQADGAFVEHLVLATIADADALSEWMQPFLDRPIKGLSPVERSVLLVAALELRTAPKSPFGAPYRVVINEAVELAKRFGGTDGHKYVNGVLDKLAATVRADEGAGRSGRRAAESTEPAVDAAKAPAAPADLAENGSSG